MANQIVILLISVSLTLASESDSIESSKSKYKAIDKQVSHAVKTVCFYGILFAIAFYLL